jgi:calcineurin-like phosphoesterase family protein
MATYACSDLHGNGVLWTKIKNFLKPDDKLYYLGDATDRGPDGWIILKEMLEDERITYIAGNHDIMLANRIRNPNSYHDTSLHHINGGYTTWEHAENDADAKGIMSKIFKLPKYAIYENINGLKIFMSHSGSTNINNEEELIWDRSEYIDRRNHSNYDIIIHGHTSIPHLIEDLEEIHKFYFQEPEAEQFKMPEWKKGAYWYHGYRCDIDCYTILTNHTVLLNLDTFDEEIFEA